MQKRNWIKIFAVKIQINSTTTLSPFAGISFFENCFNISGLKQLIDKELGSVC